MRGARRGLGLVAVLVAALGLTGGAALLLFRGGGQPAPNLRVAGRPLRGADLRAELEARADAYLREDVLLEAGGVSVPASRRDLGLVVDLDALLAEVRGYGRTGGVVEGVVALLRALRGEVDFPWPLRLRAPRLRTAIERFATHVDRAPVAPRRADEDGPARAGRDGRRLLREGAAEALGAVLLAGDRVLRLDVEGLPAPRLPPAPPPIPLRMLSGFDTRYRLRERSRSHNVALAAATLNGARIPPGGSLSFNERVGARSRRAGYRVAHVIVGGEMVDGLGGGVCQVASTLHAAAFLSGMTIVEHTPHSRPSEYIRMGLDATVVWPRVDLVIQNPYDAEIEVRTEAREGRLRVELWGRAEPLPVRWRADVRRAMEPGERRVEDPSLAPGEERVTQRPIHGFVVRRTRWIGPHPDEERLVYPPTDRIVRVGPASDDSVAVLDF